MTKRVQVFSALFYIIYDYVLRDVRFLCCLSFNTADSKAMYL